MLQDHERYHNLIESKRKSYIPQGHIDFLTDYFSDKKESFKVVYDIGSCVLQWADAIKQVLPDSQVYCFEGNPDTEILHRLHKSIAGYSIGILSDKDRTIEVEVEREIQAVNVYKQNTVYSSSYTKEPGYFLKRKRVSYTLEQVVTKNNFPMPDLIKMDVQGSEYDIIKGSIDIIKHSKAVILELPHVEYNIGAQNKEETLVLMRNLGFTCEGEFHKNGPDGDFLFLNSFYVQ